MLDGVAGAGRAGAASGTTGGASSPYRNQPRPVLRPSQPASTMARCSGEGANRVVPERGPHRPGHRLVHVLPDQVHQRERPHPEPARLGQHGVDGGRAGDPLLGQPQRLGVDGRATRFTMNPGVADAWTTCLPQSCASLVTAAATAGSVARPLTTSTSRITGAGLKKCRPTRRPGWLSPAAMAVGDSEEVLVASTQSGATTFSRSANRACLTARSSATASITHAAGPARRVRGHLQAQVNGARQPALLYEPGDPVADRGARPRGGALGGVVHDDRMARHAATCAMPAPDGAGPDHGDRRGPLDHDTALCMITAAFARSSTRRILPVPWWGTR